MPDFLFDGVSSSLADMMPISFFSTFLITFFFCIMCVTQTPPDNRQHTSSAGCALQPAGYNAIHACRLPAEQEATLHAVRYFFRAVLLLWLPI